MEELEIPSSRQARSSRFPSWTSTINFLFFFHVGTVRVHENVQIGQYITSVEARDPDEKSRLRYSIDPDNSEARNEEGALVKPTEYEYTAVFDLDPEKGVIRLMKDLDREAAEVIRLEVICEDTEAKSRDQTATATLTVVVEDVNDNNPKFKKPYYLRSVAENSKIGTTIATVVASDLDKNRSIAYSIQGPHPILQLVSLDRETGEIVVRDRIDREKFAWVNFTVQATDSGVPPRSSLVNVFVKILDENDNNPQFITRNKNSTVVREDAPPGTVISKFTAVDPDAGQYGKVTYLLDLRSSQGKFKMNPETGELSVASKLNREEETVYTLIIEAWDNYQYGHTTGESRGAFLQFDVRVADINDEVPVFEPRSGCTLVTEFHEPGDVITVIKATDGDDPETPNGRILFSIVGGNELGLFEVVNIDVFSAQLHAVRPLVGRYGNYTLLVAAQDKGVPPNSVFSNISVCVTDFNDNAPRFVSPGINVTIKVPENATVGSLVIQVRAVDDDIGINGAVKYRLKQDILGDFKTFNIDQNTGAITIARPLDRERQKLYEIRVEAYDQGIPTPLFSDLDLTIYVRNVNDFEPQFLTNAFIVNFTEHKPPGFEKVKLIETVDQDAEELGEVTALVCYFIVGGDDEGNFELEPLTHVLMTSQELDREEKSTYSLIVKATEDCLSQPTPVTYFDASDDTLLHVVVYINDINDNPPRFLREVFTGGITTESHFGYKILTLVAIDPDAAENSKLSYYMEGRVQETLSEGLENIKASPFMVNKNSGSVSLNFAPQIGMKGYFDFEVFVNDTDGLRDRARVFIYLLREDQRVRFVLRQTPEEVRGQVDYLRDYLSNVTGAIVNVDDYRIHENHDGTVDKTKTDLYLHLVDKEDNSVLEVPQVLAAIDRNVEHLDLLFKELNVLDTQRAELVTTAVVEDNLLFVWLVGVIAFMALLLVVTLSLCLAQRARYTRQLKAATATAFVGSQDAGLNRHSTVPNTNLHSIEGSNPIWMTGFENDWYKDEDSLRYQQFIHPSETSDSLDDNVVETSPRADREMPYVTHSAVSNRLSRDPASLTSCNNYCNNTERNNLSETYRSNLYQTFNKLANPLVDKKLETTEL